TLSLPVWLVFRDRHSDIDRSVFDYDIAAIEATESLPCHEPVFSRRHTGPLERAVTRGLGRPIARCHHDGRVHVRVDVAINLRDASAWKHYAAALAFGIVTEIELPG